MPNKPTNIQRQKRIKYAKAALLRVGFTNDQPASGLIVDELIAKYDIDRRTARLLEAKAARLLRGEEVALHKAGAGRPRKSIRLRADEIIELISEVSGDIVDARRYRVEISRDTTLLTSLSDAPDLILVSNPHPAP